MTRRQALSQGTGLALAIGVLALVVPHSGVRAAEEAAAKIRFDLAPLDDRGLYGPPDGLRALHYEFCIPATPPAIDEVGSIDPTAEVHPRSRGRVGCGADQALVIGSTHQTAFRDVLRRLAALPYVERIEQAHFE